MKKISILSLIGLICLCTAYFVINGILRLTAPITAPLPVVEKEFSIPDDPEFAPFIGRWEGHQGGSFAKFFGYGTGVILYIDEIKDGRAEVIYGWTYNPSEQLVSGYSRHFAKIKKTSSPVLRFIQLWNQSRFEFTYDEENDTLLGKVRLVNWKVRLVTLKRSAKVPGKKALQNKKAFTRYTWPSVSPGEAGFDGAALEKLTGQIKNGERGKIHSLLVEHKGKLVYEEYFTSDWNFFGDNIEGISFHREGIHDIHSATKSITSLLLGAALDENYEKALNRPILDYYPELKGTLRDGADKITFHHVLTMTAGLKWNTKDIISDDTDKLISSPAPYDFVLNRDLIKTPGDFWAYNNGLSFLAGEVIERITGKTLHEFAEETLFLPLGITGYKWDTHITDGSVLGYTGLQLRARDFAKIGSLVLHKGNWQGKQLIPREWIDLSTARHHKDIGVEWAPFDNSGYGYYWYSGIKKAAGQKEYNVTGSFGAGNQAIIIIPEKEMVITMFADHTYDDFVFREQVIEDIINSHSN